MPATRSQIVAAARALCPSRDDLGRPVPNTGTPFHHQGRVSGASGGLDCVGVVVHIGRILGLSAHDHRGYSRRPDGVTLRRELSVAMTPLPFEETRISARPGDMLSFWTGRTNTPEQGRLERHVAILVELGATSGAVDESARIVHAHVGSRLVEETCLGPYWLHRLVGAFRYPGVVEGRGA